MVYIHKYMQILRNNRAPETDQLLLNLQIDVGDFNVPMMSQSLNVTLNYLYYTKYGQ